MDLTRSGIKPFDYSRQGQRLEPTISIYSTSQARVSSDLEELMSLDDGRAGLGFFRDSGRVGAFDPEEERIFVADMVPEEAHVTVDRRAGQGLMFKPKDLLYATGIDPDEGWGLVIDPDSRQEQEVLEDPEIEGTILVFEAELVRRDESELF